MSDQGFRVAEIARPYLEHQKGGLTHLTGLRLEWEAALRLALERDYATVAPILRDRPGARVLDLGGGMSGVGVLLAQRDGAEVTIMDGLSDPPKPVKSWRTHSNRHAARELFAANGVRLADYIDAAHPGPPPAMSPFDLIMSFGSFGFHYEPRTYLPWVCVALERHRGVLVTDLRTDRPAWREQMERAFTWEARLTEGPKHTRDRWRRPR